MKNNRRIVEERQQKILQQVREAGEIRTEELSEQLGVSLMTLRRDLALLERRQLLRRTHGGAVSQERAHALRVFSGETARCRELVSRYAARFLEDGDRIYINGSRVALNMLQYAEEKRVRVFTNNGWAVGQTYPAGVQVNLTGGEVQGNLMMGEYVVRNLLSAPQADKAFLGCAAVYESGEFRYDIPTEISINEMMVSRTRGEIYVLAEHTKLQSHSSGHPGNGVTYDRRITLITDSLADPEIVGSLRESGIEVILVPVR